jgi:hypothetical protein
LLRTGCSAPSEALREADVALYRAKAERRSAVRFFCSSRTWPPRSSTRRLLGLHYGALPGRKPEVARTRKPEVARTREPGPNIPPDVAAREIGVAGTLDADSDVLGFAAMELNQIKRFIKDLEERTDSLRRYL